jgi:hypothetical protein
MQTVDTVVAVSVNVSAHISNQEAETYAVMYDQG